MGSISTLPRDTRNLSSTDHRIYVAFYSKSATANASTYIDCYTPNTNSWHRATSIPGIADNLILKEFAMAPLGHHIYVVGGRLCPIAAEHDSPGEDQETVVPWVQRYDVRSNSWKPCAPMSQPRFNFACIVSNNKIYVAGGQTKSGRAKGISSTEVYNPALDQWRSMANMKMRRYKCVGVTWKGSIYVVGGFIGGENTIPSSVGRSSAEVYDEKRDKWIFVARMWDLDVPPNQIVAVNERLFSSGDCYMAWKGHIEAFDEKERIWNVVHGSACDCLTPTMGRLYLTMAPIGKQLYFLAAYRMPGEASQLRSEVHVFDTAANEGGWRRLEPMEEEGEKEMCGHCCVLKQED